MKPHSGFPPQVFLLFILVQCINGVIWWFRGVEAYPERRSGYIKLVAAWVLLGNIPWFILSAGALSGRIISIEEVLKPGHGNPFVIEFFISVIVLVLLTDLWIFIGDGAQMILDHPGMSRNNTPFPSTKIVKLYALLTTASSFIAIIVMWFTK